MIPYFFVLIFFLYSRASRSSTANVLLSIIDLTGEDKLMILHSYHFLHHYYYNIIFFPLSYTSLFNRIQYLLNKYTRTKNKTNIAYLCILLHSKVTIGQNSTDQMCLGISIEIKRETKSENEWVQYKNHRTFFDDKIYFISSYVWVFLGTLEHILNHWKNI